MACVREPPVRPPALSRQADEPSLNTDVSGMNWASRVNAFSR
ncbi:hypothetical protein V2I01_33865 [Micromonospora sp. BRA006-A]|nr:hypothetical protein [Micromonospora sp. BRA006-A]